LDDAIPEEEEEWERGRRGHGRGRE